jgi:hypothetical protein
MEEFFKMKICKFCGKEIETSEFKSFFKEEDLEEMACSPECKTELLKKNKEKACKELYEKYREENLQSLGYYRLLKLLKVKNEMIDKAKAEYNWDLVTMLEFADRQITADYLEAGEKAREWATRDSGYTPKPISWTLDE